MNRASIDKVCMGYVTACCLILFATGVIAVGVRLSWADLNDGLANGTGIIAMGFAFFAWGMQHIRFRSLLSNLDPPSQFAQSATQDTDDA